MLENVTETDLMMDTIIGGGIGGTSSAYYLRQLFGANASITLFEKNVIGGRLSTVAIDDEVYEIGGTIIHPRNMYMKNFVAEFGLKERKTPSGGSMGIWNGEGFVFESSKSSFVTFVQMLWRYGYDLFRMNSVIDSVLNQFARIYTFQDAGISYNTIEGVMDAMGGEEFISWLSTPLETVLRDQGFSDRFIGELGAIASRANYGQDPDMMAFAGMVSLAGAMPGLWSVEGGNRRVPEVLLEQSGATVIKSEVRSVQRITKKPPSRARFHLTWSSVSGNVEGSGDFDIVIVATPLQDNLSNIVFEGFEPPIQQFSGDYRHTVATLVQGQPRSKTFGKVTFEELPSQIMTNIDVPLHFRTLAKNYPVDYNPVTFNTSKQVYKVFSTEDLTDEQMGALFNDKSAIVHRDWLAYPYYKKRDAEFPGFVLSDGVFYPNAIEWAASAMEMGIIGARNSAILAHNYWSGSERVGGNRRKVEVKGEL